MTALEEHLRSELHALVDDEPAPDLFPAVAAAGRRKRRLRLTTAAGGTAALVAATVLISAGGVGLGGRAERPVEKPPAPPLVTSYFPAERPPLPPHVTVRPAVGRENHVIPRQDVIASWRALWADPRYRNAKGTPTDTIGVLHTADLVVASTPGYRRPEGLGTVRDRLAWMLVSTDYTYQYRPYLAGCSIPSWWEQHKAECASPPPL